MDHFLHDWFWALFYVGVMGAGAFFFWILFSGKLWDDEYDENGYTKNE